MRLPARSAAVCFLAFVIPITGCSAGTTSTPSATASEFPPASVGHAFTPADAAACWEENGSLLVLMARKLQDALDNPWDVQGADIADARKHAHAAIFAFVSTAGTLEKRVRYHVPSQVGHIVAALQALESRFEQPMTQDEYHQAWSETYSRADEWQDWAGRVCSSIERLGGTPEPSRY